MVIYHSYVKLPDGLSWYITEFGGQNLENLSIDPIARCALSRGLKSTNPSASRPHRWRWSGELDPDTESDPRQKPMKQRIVDDHDIP